VQIVKPLMARITSVPTASLLTALTA